MPKFLPFQGLRPNQETAQDFVTLNVDHYSREEIEHYVKTRPHSFLHIIQPTWDGSLDFETRYKNVRENLEKDIQGKIISQDRSSIYIYQLNKPNGLQTHGIMGLVSIQDYRDNKIKKHEEVLQDRVDMFTNYLINTHFHAEPVLLTYKPNQRIDLLIGNELKKQPTLRVKEENGNEHLLWRVDNRLVLGQIKESISRLESLYIADGHHRMASSEKYTTHQEQHTEVIYGTETFHYTLAMLVSNDDLIIHDYNRLIINLNGLTTQEFIDALSTSYDVVAKGNEMSMPTKKHHIVLYIDGEYYNLYVKDDIVDTEGLKELDTYIFEQTILRPILGITDYRNDQRIRYLKGSSDSRSLEEIKNNVDQGKAVAGFAFYPINVNDLQLIADLGLTMPPKSTYIEPKPLSGFAIFDLKEEE
ncbi:DUF1015 domain-containing protein [Weeksella virosa]|uniref:Uncharacterized conserved protein UCP033563 n=1 Tax=Weeksella virosa (strain ATCC 43766 / DSM 16922 / JCM 21250 / CCUG 30538 / CDC 9751 / IAM 14551 / NBRC 16016 / NCTC 11634 / CL345/78) TaxID=865938 RepID=F0NYL4_WEEVC|nr:DUF1015 domain-containing protein [Weeksella virosa]ADX67134.1 Uncharacterized conserved protein UCP033563 [Weeksella virosa DSM 16922]VEH63129.1 Uncharacterized conserved protein [Weeksella virosa]